MTLSKLNIARILVLIGFFIGLNSLASTFGHIGDPLFTLQGGFPGSSTHSWYHALREGVGDVATIIIVLLIFFGSQSFRNKGGWWICLIALLGYYLPFWVGMPFNAALAAPTIDAELRHIIQAVLPIAGLLMVRKEFMGIRKWS